MTQEDDDADEMRRHLTDQERLALIERDLRSHARSLTVITKTLSGGFSEKQLVQLREAVREAFGDIGLRIDDADHVDDAREDLRFLRRFRESWDGAARKVGTTVLVAAVSVGLTIVGAGFWAWLSSKGHP